MDRLAISLVFIATLVAMIFCWLTPGAQVLLWAIVPMLILFGLGLV